ncbi:MAG: hypothetical protein IKW10_07280 [Oscillospiraceae bacterium]|nr:hypothetical protein [Oscillospiraceae bacterium]
MKGIVKKFLYLALIIIVCLIIIQIIITLTSEKTTTNPTKYLQVDTYVNNSLQEDFVGFLMDKKNYNPSNAKYYYYYTGIRYEPGFVIYLEYHFESPELFQQEITRIDSLAQEKRINHNMLLYSANSPSKSIEHYLDNNVYDGMCYSFEFTFVDQSSMTISYLTAFVQDNHHKKAIVLDFIEEWNLSKAE